MVKFFKGILELNREDYRKAISYWTEGIELRCKDDKINAPLYYLRFCLHRCLGKLTRLSFF